jgi:hypothetical protein
MYCYIVIDEMETLKANEYGALPHIYCGCIKIAVLV